MMSQSATPLPPIESPQFQGSGLHEQPNAVAAYEKILRAEAQAAQDGANEDLVSARVAGYFTLELYAGRGILGDQPFRTIINDVMQASQNSEDRKDDNSAVYEVGRKHRDHLIGACTFDRLF